MTTLPPPSSWLINLLFNILLISLLVQTKRSGGELISCETTSCESGGVSISFPFRLKQSNQSYLCGYPGFDLSCSTNPTRSEPLLLTLPESQLDLVIKSISLEDQTVWVNDPKHCLPELFIRGLNLEGSPFKLSEYYTPIQFTFLSCPSNSTVFSIAPKITCLNHVSSRRRDNINDSVVAIMTDPPFPTAWASSCRVISTASIPVVEAPWLFWTDYYSDIQLQWNNPDCGTCEARGGRCGFQGDNAFRVTCYDLPHQGLSRKVKYGLSIGLGIPGLVGIIVMTWMLCMKNNTSSTSTDQLLRERQTGTEFSTLVLMPHPPLVVMGLDGATIEKFPKTQLGESGRLPRPNDSTCSICLSEYQPKEMLRTIPECNHYFHANCIDGWLKMNATCPLCRNLPERPTPFPFPLPLSPTS